MYKCTKVFLYFSVASLLILPDEVLLRLFSYLPLIDLLRTVVPVCKRFEALIKTNSILWRYFNFDDLEHEIIFSKNIWETAMSHINSCVEFSIPHAMYTFPKVAPTLDITLNLSRSHIQHLDITGCPVSTLCFLRNLPCLETLIISECNNLSNHDMCALDFVKDTLAYLSIGFIPLVTNQPLLTVLSSLFKMTTLDAPGVVFTLEEARKLLRNTVSLKNVLFSFPTNFVLGDQFRLEDEFRNVKISRY